MPESTVLEAARTVEDKRDGYSEGARLHLSDVIALFNGEIKCNTFDRLASTTGLAIIRGAASLGIAAMFRLRPNMCRNLEANILANDIAQHPIFLCVVTGSR